MLFNASQRKGIVILLTLITCLIVLPGQFLRTEQRLFLFPDTIPLPGDSVTFIKQYPDTRKLKNVTVPKKIELNTVDSISLLKIRGIGPYYAGRIIRYRKQLGGYHSPKQLQELKMKYLDADSLVNLFTADTRLIQKKDLNTMDFKEILRHPYLEYEEVKLIFNARRQYQTVSYLLLEEKKILPLYKLKKIKPYFK